jgi:hypothetical protein
VSSIRPLERSDLPHVASLYELLLGSGSRTPRPHVAPFLERTLLDHPWADPEIPSLVHAERDGRITGFVGAQVRRMRFDGDPIRMVCVSHLVADPEVHRPIGALLLRSLLNGPQELSMTDAGTETVRAMWERLGGETVHVSCFSWTRVFRPWGFAADRLSERRGGAAPPLLRSAFSALDSATGSLAPRILRVEPPAADVEPLTTAALREHLPSVAAGLRLVPDWDEQFLKWLFDELSQKRLGELVASLVTADGQARGWFVYHLNPGGACQVVEVAAEEGQAGIVLDQLFHHAQSAGGGALQGRVEPRVLEPLSTRRCVFRYGAPMILHSKNPEILCAIESGSALLTRLEGEWVGIV